MVASLLMLSGVADLRRDGLTGVGVISRLNEARWVWSLKIISLEDLCIKQAFFTTLRYRISVVHLIKIARS